MKWMALVSLLLAALAGCASHDPHLKRIDGPSLVLREKQVFTAISGAPSGPRYYHALRPGRYKAFMEDLGGTYYIGEGPLLVLGGHATDQGAPEEPLAIGGFWLAKHKETESTMRLFYLPNFPGQRVPADDATLVMLQEQTRSLSVGQATVAGAMSGAIIGAIVDSGAVGYGPKNGEPLFVPRKIAEEEDLSFQQALRTSLPDGR